MEKIIYRISLDVNRNGIQRTIQGLETGDRYAREIRVTLRNGKEEVELPLDDNITAMMYVRTPSSSTPSINACKVDGSEIVYELKPNDVCEVGTTIMQLKVVSNANQTAERVLVAPRFAVEVWESEIDDSSATSTTTYTALETALAQAKSVYNKRITSVIIDDNNVFTIEYADGTTYESDAIAELGRIFAFRGEVATVAELPTFAETGDVYYVTSATTNYIKTTSSWNKFNYPIDLSGYTTKDELGVAYMEITNNKYQINVQKARIDNIAKLAQGSTTGDAELIDGRVGQDGVTYASIGASIRGQMVKKVTFDEVAKIAKFTDPTSVWLGQIQAKGTEQVNAVASKGTEQVNAVANKGSEVLASIPEDYTQLSSDLADLQTNVTYLNINSDDLTNDLSDFCDYGYQHIGVAFVNGNTRVSDAPYSTYRKYRAYSAKLFIREKLTNYLIEDGFRAYFNIKKEDGTYQTSNWIEGKFNLSAPYGFYVTIARVTEDTTETADALLFRNAIKYQSVLVDRIDGDISDVSDNLSMISESVDSDNLNTLGSGRYYVSASGAIWASSNKYIGMKGKVPCEPSTVYTFRAFGTNVSSGSAFYWAFYDTNGNFISRDTITRPKDKQFWYATSPSNAGYIYVDLYNSNGVNENAQIAVVEGENVPQEYVPHITSVDYVARKSIANINGTSIPEYFKENVNDAIANAKTNMERIGNDGDSFVFITDVHWGNNQKNSPELIKYVLQNSNVRNVFCGGDILDSGTVSAEKQKGYDFISRFADIQGSIKTVIGNHDANKTNHGDTSSLWLTKEQVYSMFYPKAEMETNDFHCLEPASGFIEMFYYVDVPSTNTRYLFVSVPYGSFYQVTKDWVISQFTNNPDKNIVIFTHYLINGAGEFTAGTTNFVNTVKVYPNFKTLIFGHIHYDKVMYTSNGIPMIGTDTDSSRLHTEKNPYTYDVGTITEQAFDIMSVGYGSNRIDCARVGRGKSRIVHSGINNVSINASITLTASIDNAEWVSDNESATVSNGIVSGVSAGSAIIKASNDKTEEFWYITVS